MKPDVDSVMSRQTIQITTDCHLCQNHKIIREVIKINASKILALSKYITNVPLRRALVSIGNSLDYLLGPK